MAYDGSDSTKGRLLSANMDGQYGRPPRILVSDRRWQGGGGGVANGADDGKNHGRIFGADICHFAISGDFVAVAKETADKIGVVMNIYFIYFVA